MDKFTEDDTFAIKGEPVEVHPPGLQDQGLMRPFNSAILYQYDDNIESIYSALVGICRLE